jgi:hypothetical protein
MQAFGAHPPYAVFSDSLEVRLGLDRRFSCGISKRRGYDLTPYLPALAGDMGEITGSIRHDWGKTLTELANEHYLTPLRQWAAAHGTRFRSQNYGIPPVNLSSNALVDLPEGEGSAWRRFSATRWASSASHLYGRPVTSSETWTWLHSPVFRATPLDMKAEADLHFLKGINQLVGHGWPYSPPQAGEPGWHFYAAAVFNQHNPWWIVMPDITAYLQRVSWLLRQGEPVNDVALYLPTADAYAGFTLGHDSVNQPMDRLLGPNVIPQILDGGYNYDFIDDDAIAAVGIQYPCWCCRTWSECRLPRSAKIAEYARKGGIVIATRPRAVARARIPGSQNGHAADPRTGAGIVRRPGARGHLVRDDAKLGEVLHELLRPDVTAPPEVGFVHRRLRSREGVYFWSTRQPSGAGRGEFRDGWDKRIVGPFQRQDDGIESYSMRGNWTWRLTSRASSFVLLCRTRLSSWVPRCAGGPPPVFLDLSVGWKATFAGSAQPVPMDQLTSWTEVAGMKNFSGTATYEKTFAVDGRGFRAGAACISISAKARRHLRRNTAATVCARCSKAPCARLPSSIVNGQRAGSVWHPPYEIEITGPLHAGENTLRIVVANLAINALAAQPPPDYRALIAQIRRPVSGSGHEDPPAAARGNSGPGADRGPLRSAPR